jgi:hypothetical protein
MKHSLIILIVAFTLNACSLFKSDEEKAIELVQQSKSTEIDDNKTWLDFANERAKAEPNKKQFWKAENTDSAGVFLVSFQDDKGWGTRWEATLKEKIVKMITGNDYLCMKYNLTRFDPELLFEISNVRLDTLKVEGEKIEQGFFESLFSNPKYKNVVVYRFEADVTNNTDKYITDAQIKSKLKLIFEEKTIIGANSSTSFSSSISKSKPWGPGETKPISIKTKDIDKVYLNYKPPYVVFEINLEAEDPIGFSYDKNIWEVDLTNKWDDFTAGLKEK